MTRRPSAGQGQGEWDDGTTKDVIGVLVGHVLGLSLIMMPWAATVVTSMNYMGTIINRLSFFNAFATHSDGQKGEGRNGAGWTLRKCLCGK